ncbi:hypothetical protein [Pedobacter xixiisoli]|uniref:Uncharacterized protein n=1 Tax=Pedobacter xixiisoli TaxID=1476464 RepID=A0A285ZZI3_9SPHI|nr:hypothetical protein [Pedobacter xixiisoli]SOD15050.1 hypothetical protein SAMN06297358_2022 [Pedobacter xixiisoli]
MIAFFRHRFTIYFLSSFLFLGFFLKANSFFGCKWSNIVCELEEQQPSEDEKGAKEDKSGRTIKKTWDISSPNPNQPYSKEPIINEAHNRVYLLAIITEPLIAILSEPPELA